MIFPRRREAHWFDDYPESRNYLPKMPAQSERVFLEEAALAGD